MSGYPEDAVRDGLPAPLLTLRYVAETGSTNADLLADPDGPTGEVLVADHQTAGRGRLDRRWEEPPGASIMLSVRLRPSAPVVSWGWLPLVAGVALVDALRAAAPGTPCALKWPNDVLLGDDGRKVAGILAEARGPVAVIGTGCNVSQRADQLPVPTATSLAAEGVDADRSGVLHDLLAGLARWSHALDAAGGDAVAAGLHAAYSERCATLGREVTVTRPHDVLTGRAVRIAPDAGLVLVTAAGETTVLAGDITHLRPSG
ncbi:biotin--[acetyl-CoA-carboxylase] ligase [Jatrophihabitans sp. YIM 134969]